VREGLPKFSNHEEFQVMFKKNGQIDQNTEEFFHSFVSSIHSRAKSSVVQRVSSKQVIPVRAGHLASYSSWRLFCRSRRQPQTQVVEFQ